MVRRVYCPKCTQVFAFETAEAPAQHSPAKRRRGPGRVVAYYPTCPRCRERVESPEPVPPRVGSPARFRA